MNLSRQSKYYKEYCPKCHGHNTGRLVDDKARKVRLFHCDRCGFTYAYENLDKPGPKYHNINRSHLNKE